MSGYDSVDFFTDEFLLSDPYPYFDHLRARSPVLRLPHHGVVAVTGHPEGGIVYQDSGTFSSIVAVGGPFPPLPFEPRGDDIDEQIEQYRDQMPMNQYLTTMDPPEHSRTRSLLRRLLTPKPLQANEELIRRLADEQIDSFIDGGRCEFVSGYAKPFSSRVIADLLGIPAADRDTFEAPRPIAPVGALDHAPVQHNALAWLDDKFGRYLRERRYEPRPDMLTRLASARYPDGSLPEVAEVARLATLLFTAARGATAVLLSWSLRLLAERPDLAQQLRDDHSRIPNFIEEVLRMESPVKSDFRLVRRTATLGGVTIPAGTVVMVCPGALNRDPRKFDDPHKFQLNRSNARDHVAFGRGAHTCPGALLARAEGRISLERILDRLSEIRLSAAQHGPAGARSFSYEPTYTLRALTELHLDRLA
ncbi:cytochrome P450 [Mycobacterium simiae]|uniref:Cytochrome P450 n=1 Tax=Mycobacterium simiae TaxID=1784 RepID=A0A5B1BV57_MYCSI|nr:cytochrome P450 [Mycobacterium simiae]KAA1251124.1 cytochrome P450 [Mycobacterium simiae]